MTEHFGDPFREQRALARGQAVVVFSGRGVIRLSGPDRLTWLDSLVSQDVSHLHVGDSAEALLLDPNGRVERVMKIVDDGTATWLLVDADSLALAQWLDSMVFRRNVTVDDMSDEFTVVGAFGDGAASTRISALASKPHGAALLWIDPWSDLVSGGWQYASSSDHPSAQWNYREAIVDVSGLDALGQDIESGVLSRAGMLAFDALRIAAWRPALVDVDDTSLPHEFDWLRSAVHLSKGCYRGQETVAKVHNLGHPPRRLVYLDLDGSEAVLPEPGWAVALADAPANPVGHITSAARHFEYGPIALALVKRSVDTTAPLVVVPPPDAVASTSPVAANQTVIVPSDAGKAIEVPRIKRDRVRPTRS